jgi:hypothetical protein
MTHHTDGFTPLQKAQYALWHEQRATEWVGRRVQAQTEQDKAGCDDHVRYHLAEAKRLRDEAARDRRAS